MPAIILSLSPQECMLIYLFSCFWGGCTKCGLHSDFINSNSIDSKAHNFRQFECVETQLIRY